MGTLLSSFGKKGIDLGLLKKQVDIDDTSYLSKYFVVAEFNPVLTAGKNPLAFNGSAFLKTGSEIQIECIDSNGQSLYIETPTDLTQYTDVAKFLVSIHVYNETANGAGKLVLVGTTIKNEIVRWIANVTIDKTVQNTSKVRFINLPTIEARPLLYPVVDNVIGSEFAKTITLTGSFYTIAFNPPKNTDRSWINPKTNEIDYRLILKETGDGIGPVLFPTASFNTQMEGATLELIATSVQTPNSYVNTDSYFTGSFKIKKVINSNTIQLDTPFFYNVGPNQIVTNIGDGTFNSTYTWIGYSTQSDVYQKFTPSGGGTIYNKQSYAEIVYRNLRPFTGVVARHKLYRKSLIFPGDFQLISDETLGPNEILIDPITANKSYSLIGTFYNQYHINKYWFTSSNDLQLSHSVQPFINGMKISSPSYNNMDGNKFVIVKTDALNVTNSAVYYPYDPEQFNSQSGSGYTSNFIDLKGGAMYSLTTNIVILKDKLADAKISFFFTSSTSDIVKEKNYIIPYGLKLGEISTAELVETKIFSEKQNILFTPVKDYYGTILIVPYNCNVILSDLSLKVYGDYGFSPDILFTKIPFPVNLANEAYQLKAELYDINSTLIYSNLQIIQAFDPEGASLQSTDPSDPSYVSFVSGSLTISQSLYLPNISSCPSSNVRLLGWKEPTHYPPIAGEGEICYTNVTDLSITGPALDYAQLQTIVVSGSGFTTLTATPLSIHYGTGEGRRIFINSSGTKIIDV